ncbi:Rpn family recombination-promoting nuclease/putative transposase [Sellimonas catena]|uniref:Transposase (putative) YhgA-like domain-containing protein n=1 Tax=Sellimonas catena TaxID=2994035 RepID=A0A9W6CFW9_9FIRM|nr:MULTISPECIES: Rpn family recombination-promoting nuclease/putative transposase [Clostridia]GLG03320.1 hypothetical protein Selli1_04940 [Sellimonas catena]GLG90554.1 hypothetical protein Selli2_19810 [Sellimonas catena]
MSQQENQNKPVNKKYKDTLFRMIFREKENLLELYNALNHTDYTDPEKIEITTLEDVIYVGMKNDVSFLLFCTMNLYEHQSTPNPNMPLRGFIYLARIYQNYIKQTDANIYGKTLIPLPVPKYVVFYNGNQAEADYQELCLSDAFLPTESSEEKPAVECRAVMLNINLGHNKELMEKCRALWEYAYFVNEVKENLKNGAPIESAVAEARKACIDKDILKEFLEKNSSEVEDVILEEFDREWYEKKVREESQRIGLEEGRKQGLKEGRKEGIQEGIKEGEQRVLQLCQKLLEDGRDEELSRIAEDEKLREELYREYGL